MVGISLHSVLIEEKKSGIPNIGVILLLLVLPLLKKPWLNKGKYT